MELVFDEQEGLTIYEDTLIGDTISMKERVNYLRTD